MVFGFVNLTDDGQRYNAAAVMKDGQVLGIYNKQNLPNYSVFDEKRYFNEGHQHLVFEYLGHKFGVLICEDVWSLNTVQQLAQLNVESVLVLNASPYEVGKPQHRIETLKELAKQLNFNWFTSTKSVVKTISFLMVQVLSLTNQAKLHYKHQA
jgi:NAD+ synthase (glutamine-hydrolysing)